MGTATTQRLHKGNCESKINSPKKAMRETSALVFVVQPLGRCGKKSLLSAGESLKQTQLFVFSVDGPFR